MLKGEKIRDRLGGKVEMAQVKIARRFIQNVSMFFEATLDGYPFSNALDITDPNKQARLWSDDASTLASCTIKLPDAVTLDDNEAAHFYFDHCNFRRVGLSRRGTNIVGSPMRHEWMISANVDPAVNPNIYRDPVQGVYRGVVTLPRTNQEYFSIGIHMPNNTSYPQSPVDGESYYRIGSLAIIRDNDLIEVDAQLTYPYRVKLPDTNVVETRFADGGVRRTKIASITPMRFSLGVNTGVEQNIAGNGVEQLFDLFRDPTDILYIDLGMEPWQKYLVRRVGELRAEVVSPRTGTVDFGEMTFEVVI